MSKNMWMVRAGRSAFLVQDFEDNEYVAVGWERLGDLSSINSKTELEKLHYEVYPEDKPAKRGISLGQISRFRFEIEKGDLVTTYNPEFRTYPVGEINSNSRLF